MDKSHRYNDSRNYTVRDTIYMNSKNGTNQLTVLEVSRGASSEGPAWAGRRCQRWDVANGLYLNLGSGYMHTRVKIY